MRIVHAFDIMSIYYTCTSACIQCTCMLLQTGQWQQPAVQYSQSSSAAASLQQDQVL